MEQKGKSWLEVSLQYGATSRNVGLSILFISEFEERGVRKITTGIGTPEQLTDALNRIQDVAGAIGLDIHAGKTEWMWLQPPDEKSYSLETDETVVRLGANTIKHVEKFKYLGSWITEGGGMSDEISARIAQSTGVLAKLAKFLTCPAISIRRKIGMIKMKVYPSLFYACESWMTTAKIEDKLEAFMNLTRLRILDKRRWNPKTGVVIKNSEIRSKVKLPPVREILAKRRLAFYSQLQAEPSCLLATDMLDATIAGSTKVRGRSVKEWRRLPPLDMEYLSGNTSPESVDIALNELCKARSMKNGKDRVKTLLSKAIKGRDEDLGGEIPKAPRLVNSRVQVFSCDKCLATFAEKKALYRHLREDHTSPKEGGPPLEGGGVMAAQLVSASNHSPESITGMFIPAKEELVRNEAGDFMCPVSDCTKVYKSRSYGHLVRHCETKHGLAKGNAEGDSWGSRPNSTAPTRVPGCVQDVSGAPVQAVTGEVTQSLASLPASQPRVIELTFTGGPADEPSELGSSLECPRQSYRNWGEPPPWDGSIECPYVECTWGRGARFVLKGLQNHMSKVHEWNILGHCPKRVRTTKTKCVTPDSEVVTRAATREVVGGVRRSSRNVPQSDLL